jgi:hypothetical protein
MPGNGIAASHVTAQSISRTVQEWLYEGPSTGRVLATFDHVCDLLLPDHRVVALVTPEVGNGPLNIVVEGAAGVFGRLAAGLPAIITAREVKIGAFAVSLRRAAVWKPRPDWNALREELPAIQARLEQLHAFCSIRAPRESLFGLLKVPADATRHTDSAIGNAPKSCRANWQFALHRPTFSPLRMPQLGMAIAWQALDLLRAGWEGNAAQLRKGTLQLAGLGGGLTPSGVMLWAWLTHPTPDDFCKPIIEAAEERTTVLSMAFLRAAARGECNAAWQALLKALTHKGDAEIARAAEDVLAHGATSGADALAGFLWAGLYLPTRLPSPAAPYRSFPPREAGR